MWALYNSLTARFNTWSDWIDSFACSNQRYMSNFRCGLSDWCWTNKDITMMFVCGVCVCALLHAQKVNIFLTFLTCLIFTKFSDKPQNATVFSALVVKASNTSSVLEIQKKTPGEEGLVSVFLDYQPFYFTSNVTQLSGIFQICIYLHSAFLSF